MPYEFALRRTAPSSLRQDLLRQKLRTPMAKRAQTRTKPHTLHKSTLVLPPVRTLAVDQMTLRKKNAEESEGSPSRHASDDSDRRTGLPGLVH